MKQLELYSWSNSAAVIFMSCRNPIGMRNSLKTSKWMEHSLIGGDCGCLAMRFFWWYLVSCVWGCSFLLLFLSSCDPKYLIRKNEPGREVWREKPSQGWQGFLLASADPQLWANYWNAGMIVDLHCVQKVFKNPGIGVRGPSAFAQDGVAAKAVPSARSGWGVVLLPQWQVDLLLWFFL